MATDRVHVPEITCQVTVPVSVPPVVVSVSVCPKVAVVDETKRAAWLVLLIVIVVSEELTWL